MDSQQCGIQEDAMCRMYSICYCSVGDKGDNDDTANTVSSNISMDNIEIEGTGTVSSIVRACYNGVSYVSKPQNW